MALQILELFYSKRQMRIFFLCLPPLGVPLYGYLSFETRLQTFIQTTIFSSYHSGFTLETKSISLCGSRLAVEQLFVCHNATRL